MEVNMGLVVTITTLIISFISVLLCILFAPEKKDKIWEENKIFMNVGTPDNYPDATDIFQALHNNENFSQFKGDHKIS